MWQWLMLFFLFLPLQTNNWVQVCPGIGIQARTNDFEGRGIILTAWDRTSLWIYDIGRNARYPLPESAPCNTNCHLSPDGRWYTYLNTTEGAFGIMYIDGTARQVVAPYSTEISWWSDEWWLVWQVNGGAHLQNRETGNIQPLDVEHVINLQPGGFWGIEIDKIGEDFSRTLVNIQDATAQPIPLGIDLSYYNTASWSNDGAWLATTIPILSADDIYTTEIFGVNPQDGTLTQWTDLNQHYGTVRVNGLAPGSISWSPDNRYLAFWVIPQATSQAQIHIYDTQTRDIRVYCDYATVNHSPNTPRLIWSPDSRFIAFSDDHPETGQTLLLAMTVESGVFTQLSADVASVFGRPDVYAWGIP